MNANNRLNGQQDKCIEYDSFGTTVKLSPRIVRDYLVNGNGNVTDQEVVLFLNLCKVNRLNPMVKEAYLIKNGQHPATIVIGKDAFMKRARRNAGYAGHEAGVVVRRKDGELEYRAGSLTLADEEIVGGWAKVHVKGATVPIEATVSFREYRIMKDGRPMSNWAAKPATMIRKVALVQALREAFPDDLSGMYDGAETGVDENAMPALPAMPEPREDFQEEPAVEDDDPFA